jgi:hypothetical protein
MRDRISRRQFLQTTTAAGAFGSLGFAPAHELASSVVGQRAPLASDALGAADAR